MEERRYGLIMLMPLKAIRADSRNLNCRPRLSDRVIRLHAKSQTRSMVFLASALLPFVLAAALAVAAAVLWRDTLPRPLLFFTLSFVLVLGVHRVVQAVVDIGKAAWPRAGGYFLDYQANSTAYEAVARQLTLEASVIALVVAVLSYFLLRALRISVRP